MKTEFFRTLSCRTHWTWLKSLGLYCIDGRISGHVLDRVAVVFRKGSRQICSMCVCVCNFEQRIMDFLCIAFCFAASESVV